MTSATDKSSLPAIPVEVTECYKLIDQFDEAFFLGFGRLGSNEMTLLRRLAEVFADSPLGPRIKEAKAAISKSEFQEKHFISLAMARAALLGSCHDALLKSAKDTLGRSFCSSEPEFAREQQEAPSQVTVWLESVRQWLMEIAISGFFQLGYEQIGPFLATLKQIQSEPRLIRLSALVTGFIYEIERALPIDDMPAAPKRRWIDLWSRAMILAIRVPVELASQTVDGCFKALGLDLHHHPFFFSATVYGLFECNKQLYWTSMSLSSYKVDLVVLNEMWELLDDHSQILSAIAGNLSLELTGATLQSSGELIPGQFVSPGAPFSACEESRILSQEGAVQFPSRPGSDRHPLLIAEPIALQKLALSKDLLSFQREDGQALPLALDRLGEMLLFPAEKLSKAKGQLESLSLLRFDNNQWSLQPLFCSSLAKKSAAYYSVTSPLSYVRKKKKKTTVSTLKERASRLLREKS
jgi:hypothetical protein